MLNIYQRGTFEQVVVQDLDILNGLLHSPIIYLICGERATVRHFSRPIAWQKCQPSLSYDVKLRC